MNELKIRAWDKKNKTFLYNVWGGITFPTFTKRTNSTQWIKQFFIGSTDRDGTDLYAGDLVKRFTDSSNSIGEIIFRADIGLGFYDINWGSTFDGGETDACYLVKVGTRFENPELLEKK